MKHFIVILELTYLAVLGVCDALDAFVLKAPASQKTYQKNHSLSFLHSKIPLTQYLSTKIFRKNDKVQIKGPKNITSFFPQPLSLPEQSILVKDAGKPTYALSFNLDNIQRVSKLNLKEPVHHIYKRDTNEFEDTGIPEDRDDSDIDIGEVMLIEEHNVNKFGTDELKAMKKRAERICLKIIGSQNEIHVISELLNMLIREIERGSERNSKSQGK